MMMHGLANVKNTSLNIHVIESVHEIFDRPHMSLIRVQTNNWFNLLLISVIACAFSNEACIIA